jgi:DNA-binding NarL/FixJ family response regulator
MIRVVIADAHHIMRQGLRALLERTDDIQIIGEAEDGQQACELVEQLAPEVIVMDLAMPRLNGLEVVARLRARGVTTPVVILSEHSDSVSVRQALQSGVYGYLLKRSVAEELPLAIRAASRKEIYLTPSVTAPLLQGLIGDQSAQQVKTGFDALTSREREVLQLVAEGKTNRAIAHALHLSDKMVEQHRASLTAKLNVRDTAGLVRLAVQHGLVSLDE